MLLKYIVTSIHLELLLNIAFLKVLKNVLVVESVEFTFSIAASRPLLLKVFSKQFSKLCRAVEQQLFPSCSAQLHLSLLFKSEALHVRNRFVNKNTDSKKIPGTQLLNFYSENQVFNAGKFSEKLLKVFELLVKLQLLQLHSKSLHDSVQF